MIDIGCNISDKALLRALAEDVPEMALSIRERLRELADKLPTSRAPEGTNVQAAKPVAHVAEVHANRYTVEWTNGVLPEGTPLYATLSSDRAMLEHVTRALGDLSFECYAVFDVHAPTKATYNRTFGVLEEARAYCRLTT